jgi:GxxExxY protein
MLHEGLTRQVIGAAYTVYNELGSGFLESVYEKCMAIELRDAGHDVLTQHPIKVQYKGHVVGEFFADLYIDGRVIAELKAVRTLLPVHEAQLVNYLRATGIDVGILLNFADAKVEVRRKLRTLPDDPPEAPGF